MFDRTARRKHDLETDDDQDETRISSKLEGRIRRKVGTRTGGRAARSSWGPGRIGERLGDGS